MDYACSLAMHELAELQYSVCTGGVCMCGKCTDCPLAEFSFYLVDVFPAWEVQKAFPIALKEMSDVKIQLFDSAGRSKRTKNLPQVKSVTFDKLQCGFL